VSTPDPAIPGEVGAGVTGHQLARAVEQLVNQVAHWTPARWTRSGSAVAVHALVQRLADLDAAVEGLATHRVPRLDSDLALPDQLKVVTVDLLAADPPAPVLAEALAAVRAARPGTA
jgi:hypothetical protein